MSSSDTLVAILRPKLANLHISLNNIISATNNFADDHLIKAGIIAHVYKGKLFSKEHIDVIIRRFHYSVWLQHFEFLSEVSTLSLVNHTNTLSFVGFCDDNGEMMLVFKYENNGSLDSYLSDPNLTWSQRLKICLGAAHALRYIHKDIEGHLPNGHHHDIKCSKILLDKDWEAKLFCFGFHILNKFVFHSTSIYTDPSGYGWWNHMSDVYSLGVIFFEVLFERKAQIIGDKESLVSVATRLFEEGKLEDMINPDLRKQIHPLSISIFSQLAYDCVKKRSTMDLIVERLQEASDLLSIYERLEETETSLKHMKIQLSDIKVATNNYTETYIIGKGGYGVVYRAELHVFDKTHSRKRTVAVKRVPGKTSELRNTGFFDELEIIRRCEHPNIISLLGFCFEDSENILVFEYATNGSLDDYMENGKLSKLPWARRLKMCLDIAYGLSYLHTPNRDKKCIIHRDIKSGNILLGENLEVKIADFGLSIFHPKNHLSSTINTEHYAGTHVYMDPEYQEGKLKIESDVYSFGVVLFEILSGKVAYDRIYTKENGNGIAAIARQRFKDGKLMEMVDVKIMEEAHELSSTIIIGPSQDSLDEFFKVAYKCVAEVQADRPKMKEVIDRLERAIDFQKKRKDTLEISLENIRLGGKNLSNTNCNIEKGYDMYDGEVQYDNETKPVIVKRMSNCGQKPLGSWKEFEIPFKYKHENVIGLVGYCKKMNEKFIVFENAINKSLDMHVGKASLIWIKRLKIGIDIANGLKFLHGTDEGKDAVIHRDLKSSNILLTGDWNAKVCGFDASIIYPKNQKIHYADDGIGGSPGYCDPLYLKTRILTAESDIYSLGVILFELLCGRLAYIHSDDFLDSLVKDHYDEERPYELVFECIREDIEWESLVAFTTIAFQCLHDDIRKRPTASEVVVQLQQALKLQEAQVIWDAKLPRNYYEILKHSKTPEIYLTMEKKDIYSLLSRGIPLQKGKLWYSIGDNGERSEMISAKMFSYKKRWLRGWQTIQDGRFKKVAEMLDVRNLNIQFKRGPQLLLPSINYKVHLVFKFCYPRKSHAKRMYVNLKYKMGDKNLNSYFATWREDGWMMIELGRFSANKEKTDIKIILESFSRCYCDSRAIYIQGIEFRAVDDVKQEEIEKLDEIQQPNLKYNSEMDKKEDAKRILYYYSEKKLILLEGSSYSRIEGIGIELLQLSVFHIKWKLSTRMVSPKTEHVCYLVFKLSENCRGLHCPVLVRNQDRWKSKETIYFRHPSPWNLHETDRVPKERRDGWMEVILWIYDSNYKLRNDFLHVNLKLISYEGTMSGLIIGGLEFRPMEK